MKNRIINILTKPADSYGHDIILPRREAELIADKLLSVLGTVAYICDEKACSECNHENCYYTTDIHHAKHFQEIEPGKFMEIYAIPPLKVKGDEDNNNG